MSSSFCNKDCSQGQNSDFVPKYIPSVEDIDLRVTRQERPGYSYGRCQKPGAKLEDDGPEMGEDPDTA